MVERTGHRLRHLDGKRRRRIVGQAMVLAALVGKFCLQKKIVARDQASAIRGGQSPANSFFEIMPSLVRSVDAAKTATEREFDKGRGTIFLPGGSIEEIGN